MKPQIFVNQFKRFALLTEEKTGISAVAILAQAALESGWGEKAPGNMFFGIKDTDGINGNEQLILTTEYSRRADDFKKNKIVSVTPVMIKGIKFFKYKLYAYFRKYETPEESFTDHAEFLIKNRRYFKAMLVAADPYKFTDELVKAGYATGQGYKNLMYSLIKTIQRYM